MTNGELLSVLIKSFNTSCRYELEWTNLGASVTIYYKDGGVMDLIFGYNNGIIDLLICSGVFCDDVWDTNHPDGLAKFKKWFESYANE